MKVFTIGFTKKSAEMFFGRLARAGVTRLVDVRLNNVSQLAGFTKRDDLRYFARAICHIDYVHVPALAPTRDILTAYQRKQGDWPLYERRFLKLMRERQVERTIARDLIDGACLLCSEEKPDHCHRRLVAEYLGRHWGNLDIEHLP
jgi:uncharacterized protein (DUF488 family)